MERNGWKGSYGSGKWQREEGNGGGIGAKRAALGVQRGCNTPERAAHGVKERVSGCCGVAYSIENAHPYDANDTPGVPPRYPRPIHNPGRSCREPGKGGFGVLSQGQRGQGFAGKEFNPPLD